MLFDFEQRHYLWTIGALDVERVYDFFDYARGSSYSNVFVADWTVPI